MARVNSFSDDNVHVVSHKQQSKTIKNKSKIVTDEHHEDRDKKHEEGHISKMRNMLKPMRVSSFYAPLTSIKTTGRFCRLSSGENTGAKPESTSLENPGESTSDVSSWQILREMFSRTVRHLLYTDVAKKNIDIVIFFFYSLYKGMNLWSWLKWPFQDGFLFLFFPIFMFSREKSLSDYTSPR